MSTNKITPKKIRNESFRTIQRMQKVLQMMNCRLDNTVSNIVGESGRRIIMAILAGERDSEKHKKRSK
jgi:transposase